MLGESPQSDDESLDNISQAIKRYLDEREYFTEEKAIEIILEKTRQASRRESIPDEEEIIASILQKTRQAKENDENLMIAMENVYISKLLLVKHSEFPRNALIHIAKRLSRIRIALGKLFYEDTAQVRDFQEKLDAEVTKIFNELARYNQKQISGNTQKTEIELGTDLRVGIINLLEEVENGIELIRDSYSSNSETPTS